MLRSLQMDGLQGSRVLVTGAGGLIGANLVRELLNRGAEVHALTRPSTRLWRITEIIPQLILHLVDLTDREQLHRTINKARPEIIIHLASPSGHPSQPQDRAESLVVNILGTANLLEATAPLEYHRFVHFGSPLEYGSRDKPLEESHPLEPLTFRGAAKAGATLLCQQFARANRRPVVILRPFMVYGYWQAPTRLIPTAIRAALLNQEMALTSPGYRRDWIFVEDVVDACLLTLKAENVAGEIINVGSGQQWSNEEVVDSVQAVTGQKIRVRVGGYPARPHDTTFWVADIRKARRLLGWEPHHTFQRGLEKTIAWFRLHHDIYQDLIKGVI